MIPWKIINGETYNWDGDVLVSSRYHKDVKVVKVANVSKNLVLIPSHDDPVMWWRWMWDNGWTHWTPINPPEDEE